MSNSGRVIQDYLDLVEEAGWRTRKTVNGMQIFPPNGGPIITIHDLRRSDHVGLQALHSQLKRAGLKFPNDSQKKEKPTVANEPNKVAAVPVATPAEPDHFALITHKIGMVVTLMSEIEEHLKQIHGGQARLAQLRELLKGI